MYIENIVSSRLHNVKNPLPRLSPGRGFLSTALYKKDERILIQLAFTAKLFKRINLSICQWILFDKIIDTQTVIQLIRVLRILCVHEFKPEP